MSKLDDFTSAARSERLKGGKSILDALHDEGYVRGEALGIAIQQAINEALKSRQARARASLARAIPECCGQCEAKCLAARLGKVVEVIVVVHGSSCVETSTVAGA